MTVIEVLLEENKQDRPTHITLLIVVAEHDTRLILEWELGLTDTVRRT
jgi:hypothetical protein